MFARRPMSLAILVVLACGCSSTWEPWRADGWEGEIGPGTDLPRDGAAEGLPPQDAPDAGEDAWLPDTPPPDAPEDLATDPAGADDGGVIDVPDTTQPKVISAFSTDGRNVTVRFSEAMAPGSAQVVDNYTVVGGGSTIVPVMQATLHDQWFVTLTLDPSKPINPSLTYEVRVDDVQDVAGNDLDPKFKTAKVKRSVYVAIVWHQHQPFYGDARGEELTGPWVRKHATKDYYDMASVLEGYPDVHVTINLTAVMLVQLLTYYVDRIGETGPGGQPLIDLANDRVDEANYLAEYRGRSDPWIDLLLDDTPDPEGILAPRPTDRQLELFYNSAWTCLSTSAQLMQWFPEYLDLRNRAPASYTRDDLLALKLYFEIAWMDPDFLNGPVTLPDGLVVDLTDVVNRDAHGRYTLAVGGLHKEPACIANCASKTGDARTQCEAACTFAFDDPGAAEALANRLVAENFKIMKNIVGIHKKLRYDPDARTGQIEIATTPFYHPILPLIADTDLMAKGQPYDPKPTRFSYADDARAQVAKAVAFYQGLFGQAPKGMWPGEGSVAEAVVDAFVRNGIRWIATDQQVLQNTLQDMGQTVPTCFQCQPYRLDSDTATGDGGDATDEMAIVFRVTDTSDKMGFKFQGYRGTDAAAEFMGDISRMAPTFGGADRLVTIILDGENAWESYSKEHDGKGFHHALYRALQDGYQGGEVVPVSVSEYLQGNPSRNVAPHPIHDFKELEPLWPGSWIGGTFSTWIGEAEENTAWGYLLRARKALEVAGLARPNPAAPKPDATADEKGFHTYMAWEEIYAAEGSDWFWWYGDDMTSPANDDSPFDLAFRSHLNGMYAHLNDALVLNGQAPVTVPDFAPIVQAKAKAPTGPFAAGSAPTIDGKENPPDEWSLGGLFFDNDSGAVANPDDRIASVKYGYSADTFYVAVLTNDDLSKAASGYQFALYLSQKHILDATTGQFQQNPFNAADRWGGDLGFVTGGAAWELKADLTAKPPTVTWSAANGSGGWTAAAVGQAKVGGPVTGGRLLEFSVPLSQMQIASGDPLEFKVVAGDASRAIDPAPNLGGKVVFEDASNLVYVTFEVDATGSKVPLDNWGDIPNPPPTGKVYVAGNHDKLGNWIPNKVDLRDDGKSGDATANDLVYSRTFGFMPGTMLRYKFTIGVPTDEGRWTGEEFPLTERGLEVTKDPSCKKMKIRDVFADRPQPSGTMGPQSVLNDCAE